MQVLLRESIDKLGNRGDVVKVAPGYARNFLFPKNMAMPVTEGNRKQLEVERRNYERKQLEAKSTAEEAKEKLEAMEITISKRAGENAQLFGSVTNSEVAELLHGKGFDIDRRKIAMPTIKEIGAFTAHVKLHPEVTAELKLTITPIES